MMYVARKDAKYFWAVYLLINFSVTWQQLYLSVRRIMPGKGFDIRIKVGPVIYAPKFCAQSSGLWILGHSPPSPR